MDVGWMLQTFTYERLTLRRDGSELLSSVDQLPVCRHPPPSVTKVVNYRLQWMVIEGNYYISLYFLMLNISSVCTGLIVLVESN